MPNPFRKKEKARERETVHETEIGKKKPESAPGTDQLAIDLAHEWNSAGDIFQQHLYVE